MKNYWIILGKKESFEECILKEECWGHSKKDIFTGQRIKGQRIKVKVGDEVVFYLTGGEGFKGIFEVVKGPVKKEEKDNSFVCNECKSKIKIKKIKFWKFAKPMNENLIKKFSFIKNKSNWNPFIWGKSLIYIEKNEYEEILKQPSLAPEFFDNEEMLKDYVHQNWYEMDFDEPLTIFNDGKGDGREYPAGTAGKIDFLCLDKNNDFVVLEFKKKNKTDDETIGQTSRYIGWVEGNLANNKKVRGIIITTNRFTDKIKYAAKSNPKISLMKIKITFKFSIIV